MFIVAGKWIYWKSLVRCCNFLISVFIILLQFSCFSLPAILLQILLFCCNLFQSLSYFAAFKIASYWESWRSALNHCLCCMLWHPNISSTTLAYMCIFCKEIINLFLHNIYQCHDFDPSIMALCLTKLAILNLFLSLALLIGNDRWMLYNIHKCSEIDPHYCDPMFLLVPC